MMQRVVLFLAGALFGFGLAISGMTDPTIVTGFLDVTGDWNPALMFVMAGALGSYALSMWFWGKRSGGKGWFGSTLPKGESDPVRWPLVVGSALFGAGWGLSGFCPGPALANLAAWHWAAVVFVPAMALGMWVASRLGKG